MIRRLILSATAGAVAITGLVLTPASADAHPRDHAPVYRPVYYPPAHYPHHHHHHGLFGVRLYVPPAPAVVARPVVPAPVVVAPVCPTPPVVVPYPR